jgi:hypothetical protein
VQKATKIITIQSIPSLPVSSFHHNGKCFAVVVVVLEAIVVVASQPQPTHDTPTLDDESLSFSGLQCNNNNTGVGVGHYTSDKNIFATSMSRSSHHHYNK